MFVSEDKSYMRILVPEAGILHMDKYLCGMQLLVTASGAKVLICTQS